MASTPKGVAVTVTVATAASTPIDPIDLLGFSEEQTGGYWVFVNGANSVWIFFNGESAAVLNADGVVLPANQWMYLPRPKKIATGAAVPNQWKSEVPWTARALTADAFVTIIADRGGMIHPA